jgi:DNA repair exonuclease SbcCD ATPase subunit
MAMKINKLEIENVKRVKAVRIEPNIDGFTIIGGDNNQGKTSILDAIAWALGGNKYRPSKAQREGSLVPPNLKITMNNGLIVERKGKNSTLQVTDPSGQKGGQQLLDSFVEELAINLPKFMESTSKQKADTLLQIIGVQQQLIQLEQQETEAYNQRRAVGQIADQKKKFAKEQPYYPDAPKELQSANDLIKQQQDILAQNGENQAKRNQLAILQSNFQSEANQLNLLEQQLHKLQEQHQQTQSDLEIAKQSSEHLVDVATDKLEQNIANVEETNRMVRANLDKDKAEQDAQQYKDQYDQLTNQVDQIRSDKAKLLNSAKLPLPRLSVEDGELIYNGQKWDNMSGSDQLKVSTAIVRQLKPNCGFVLMDKLEQMDLATLQDFGAWLKQEDLQAIATRVSNGDECSIIIEDGYVKGAPLVEEPEQPKTWKEGQF